jgi:hypothetical protein
VELSLTGPDSHRLVRSPGVGVGVIGPPRGTPPRPDLVVGVDDAAVFQLTAATPCGDLTEAAQGRFDNARDF